MFEHACFVFREEVSRTYFFFLRGLGRNFDASNWELLRVVLVPLHLARRFLMRAGYMLLSGFFLENFENEVA